MSVGQIVQAIENMDALNNTLIIFTADNGADIPVDKARPEGQAREAGLMANGPHRGDKHTIYEGGGRVPLLVSWEGKIPSSTVSERMVSIADVFATIAELVQGETGDDPGRRGQHQFRTDSIG